MSMILALEPDERQAAILSGVIMNQLRADLVLVDSKSAAVAAMARETPDLVLLTPELTRAEEKEIIARLRARDPRVQTLSIPPLVAAPEEESESGGLLRAFRRKRQTDNKPATCDPRVFAREIRTRLRRIELARARPVVEAAPPPPPAESRPAEAPQVDPWSWAARAPVPPTRMAAANVAPTKAASQPPPVDAAETAPRPWVPLHEPSEPPAPLPFFASIMATYGQLHAAPTPHAAGSGPAASELAGVVRGLLVPEAVALFAYPRACRIEQVHVARRPANRHATSVAAPPSSGSSVHSAAMA